MRLSTLPSCYKNAFRSGNDSGSVSDSGSDSDSAAYLIVKDTMPLTHLQKT